MQQYDEQHEVQSVADKHSSVNSSKDRDIIIKELVNNQVFDIIPERKHKAFTQLSPNLASHLKEKEHMEWMQLQWRKLRAGFL